MEKIEVTDEMVDIATEAYCFANIGALCLQTHIRSALEAVFNHISNHPEKPDSSVGAENAHTSTQNLLQFAIWSLRNESTSLDILTPAETVEIVSDYLEKYMQKKN